MLCHLSTDELPAGADGRVRTPRPRHALLCFRGRRWPMARTFFWVLGYLSCGWLLPSNSGMTDGSCGHYVFTKTEWAIHTSQQVSVDLSAANFVDLITGSLPRPGSNRQPCHGPGCRGGEPPVGWSVPPTASSDRLHLDGILSEATAVLPTVCTEPPRYQPLLGCDFGRSLWRPPRG